mmetsp:Transcript_11011/g.41012  ORF Transcript_11011/g.41012 Transcript_11011/m.41012 type:complete len:212 (-) Transcript_11011:2529-3164(-)
MHKTYINNQLSSLILANLAKFHLFHFLELVIVHENILQFAQFENTLSNVVSVGMNQHSEAVVLVLHGWRHMLKAQREFWMWSNHSNHWTMHKIGGVFHISVVWSLMFDLSHESCVILLVIPSKAQYMRVMSKVEHHTEDNNILLLFEYEWHFENITILAWLEHQVHLVSIGELFTVLEDQIILFVAEKHLQLRCLERIRRSGGNGNGQGRF